MHDNFLTRERKIHEKTLVSHQSLNENHVKRIKMNSALIFALLFCSFIITIETFHLGNIECDVDPEPAAMSQLKCDSDKCEVTCLPNYKFPNGETKLELICVNRRRWIARNYNEVPHCIRKTILILLKRSFNLKKNFSNL